MIEEDKILLYPRLRKQMNYVEFHRNKLAQGSI